MDTAASARLIPQLQTLHDQVSALRRDAERLAAELTEAQWDWSPAPKRWSLAQILDHLNRTAASPGIGAALLPRIQAALEELRAKNLRSEGPFRYSLRERLFIRILSPDPPFKVPVPPQFVPAPAPDARSVVVPEFLKLQDGLLRCLEAANGLDLKRAQVDSPVNSAVRMSVGGYLEATVAHERYHWTQAQALLADPRFPAA
jgi:hypothetical protein